MGMKWTDQHYDLLDEIYVEALGRQSLGRPVSRSEMVEAAIRVTQRSAGSVSLQFANMTYARAELRLPVLGAVGAMTNRAQKLIAFLKGKYFDAP